jgi:hypothetical protein
LHKNANLSKNTKKSKSAAMLAYSQAVISLFKYCPFGQLVVAADFSKRFSFYLPVK